MQGLVDGEAGLGIPFEQPPHEVEAAGGLSVENVVPEVDAPAVALEDLHVFERQLPGQQHIPNTLCVVQWS